MFGQIRHFPKTRCLRCTVRNEIRSSWEHREEKWIVCQNLSARVSKHRKKYWIKVVHASCDLHLKLGGKVGRRCVQFWHHPKKSKRPGLTRPPLGSHWQYLPARCPEAFPCCRTSRLQTHARAHLLFRQVETIWTKVQNQMCNSSLVLYSSICLYCIEVLSINHRTYAAFLIHAELFKCCWIKISFRNTLTGDSECHLKATQNAEGGAGAQQQRLSKSRKWLPLV